MSRINPKDSIYLRGRKCLEIPPLFDKLLSKYPEVIYETAKSNIFSSVSCEYILQCYSRTVFPSCAPPECVTIDLHYIDLLCMMMAWYRTEENSYLDEVFCALAENNYLNQSEPDYEDAAFIRWIRSKTTLNPFTSEDLNGALLINLIAIMHESSHAITDFQEFDIIYAEHAPDLGIDPTKDEIRREVKSDFFALTNILTANTKQLLGKDPEEILDLYYIMQMLNCMFQILPSTVSKPADMKKLFESSRDRLLMTLHMMRGTGLQPNLNWDKILARQPSEKILRGYRYIADTFLDRITPYQTEYTQLPQADIEATITALKEEEARKRQNSFAYIYPDPAET